MHLQHLRGGFGQAASSILQFYSGNIADAPI